ncbi:hypothetical protein [Streptomyces sp. NRRL F-5123]|uniref:hypothetical protein n=1 Tax=Streptomyces sp. NRRL F-5123 TaxID=1463856 RepID=UPI002D21AB09|nr:hypothetical protein [Streptomyces sp. NRRL F-5123]
MPQHHGRRLPHQPEQFLLLPGRVQPGQPRTQRPVRGLPRRGPAPRGAYGLLRAYVLLRAYGRGRARVGIRVLRRRAQRDRVDREDGGAVRVREDEAHRAAPGGVLAAGQDADPGGGGAGGVQGDAAPGEGQQDLPGVGTVEGEGVQGGVEQGGVDAEAVLRGLPGGLRQLHVGEQVAAVPPHRPHPAGNLAVCGLRGRVERGEVHRLGPGGRPGCRARQRVVLVLARIPVLVLARVCVGRSGRGQRARGVRRPRVVRRVPGGLRGDTEGPVAFGVGGVEGDLEAEGAGGGEYEGGVEGEFVDARPVAAVRCGCATARRPAAPTSPAAGVLRGQ